jgi:hypothetical protein
MNSNATDKIIKTTVQHLSAETSVSLTFHYPANFKIGDTIEVIALNQDMQLFAPQHEEGCFLFEVEIWDDRIRLQCDSMKQLENNEPDASVFSFKIREIDLFANAFPVFQKAVAYK